MHMVAVGLLGWALADGPSHAHGGMAPTYPSMAPVVLLVQLPFL